MIHVIPAHPGFFAVWTYEGVTHREPVIAWRIDTGGNDIDVEPLGVAGWCDSNVEIIGPDGQVIPAGGVAGRGV